MGEVENSDKAFFDALKKYWYVWLPILILGIIWGFKYSNDQDELLAKSKVINMELENIEDKIKIEILNHNKQKALLLTNKLVHPYHEIYEGSEENWYSGPQYFDLYWDAKRQKYKDEIFSLK